MAYYRLYFFHPRSHGIVRFVEIDAETDAAANAAALEHRGEMALELWEGKRKVASIEANDLTSRVLSAKRSRDSAAPSRQRIARRSA